MREDTATQDILTRRVSEGIGRQTSLTLRVSMAVTLILLPGLSPAMAQTLDHVEFNRDIRPILSATCFQCHGPDQNARQAELRLDIRDEAIADRDGSAPIVPGNAAQSMMYQRITAADGEERMPPPEFEIKLSPQQVELIERWINEGAKYQPHWSLVAPVRPPLPDVKRASWPRNGIDRFILARLEREGLAPSPEADRTTLIRRVTFDLTGLPPMPQEVDQFLDDNVPGAYERLVDRLLASPRYGERMAALWLDAARYADTNGYQNDGGREMWRWRDWVIESFNGNQPFDQFTIEQLAGDLLPNPMLSQRIATGFNRNHRGNSEGGIIPEEYQVEYVVDRVDTTSTVWLGLTIACARCHDHKFDPATQKEFYQLFAYFNNIPELGRARIQGNSPPMIKAPTPLMQQRLAELEAQLAAAETEYGRLESEVASAQSAWEPTLASHPPIDWTISDNLIAHFPLDGNVANAVPEPEAKKVAAEAAAVETPQPRPSAAAVGFSAGQLAEAAVFDGGCVIEADRVVVFKETDKFSYGAWVYPEGDRNGAAIARMDDEQSSQGYDLSLRRGRVQVNLVNRVLDDAIRVETRFPLARHRWHHVFMTYDGSKTAGGVKIYVDGQPQRLRVLMDVLNNSISAAQPLRIGAHSASGDYQGLIDDVRLYDRALTPEEVEVLASAETVTAIAAIAASERTEPQAHKIREYFVRHHAPEALHAAHRRIGELRRERQEFEERIPTVMVMQEMETPRETFVLRRGEYDKPDEKVTPAVPASLPPLSADAPNNRLGLARWLVDSSHPLTARVTVNRYWQVYFGTGLVKTTEDFGSQGEWPVHPELLDWLATEFIRTGWDVKGMQRLIVTSAAYRQSSKLTPALARRDPENRLLARGPRFRLSADVLRDQALAAGGLLVEQLGGPSVKPYQPEGLWEEVATTKVYDQDHGEKLYRRSLYTFWKRTVAPPSMMNFDAASRESCSVRAVRTNTPLQALTLLNETGYVEAARKLAERVMREAGEHPDERITLAFRLATSRRPSAAELRVLREGLEYQRERYCDDPDAALKLLSVGESPRDVSLPASELAAYTTLAGLILNLDETVTKQ